LPESAGHREIGSNLSQLRPVVQAAVGLERKLQ
jgi:hypothetical protein